MKSTILAATIALSATTALAQGVTVDTFGNVRVDPYGGYSSPQPSYPYRGASGLEYQYDMNRPSDRLLYQVDPPAQQRDRLNVDPRRELDRGFGQYGGGVRR